MSDGTNPFRQSVIILPMRTHVMSVGGGLIHAHKKSTSTGCTNWRSRKNFGVSLPLLGQLIEVRCFYIPRPVATEIKFEVFPHNPENIWLLFGKTWGAGKSVKENKEKKIFNNLVNYLLII